jgi:polyisoprenoid-binding protein YceI
MMRRVFCAAVLVTIVSACFAGAAEFALSGKNTTITFVGTKPNGKHDGGFKELTGIAAIDGNDVTTLKISVEIDMQSLYADNNKLTNHLKSPDFFGIKSNPKSKFVSTKVDKAGGDVKITGDLTMCGQTKSVTFPAQIQVNGDGLTLSSKFTVDKSQWGMTYGRGKIHDEVKLTVNVNAKK